MDGSRAMKLDARTVSGSVHALPSTPADVARFLQRSRIPRKRATRKLEDVLRRLPSQE
jgi:hypothetical protein